MDFEKKIKEGCQLGKIVKCQWFVKGENLMFEPEKVSVLLEDEEGIQWELVIHCEPYLKEWYYKEEVILNTVLAFHGLIPSGMWIGVNCELNEMVNTVRKQFEPEFHTNEKECAVNPWITPIVIF